MILRLSNLTVLLYLPPKQFHHIPDLLYSSSPDSHHISAACVKQDCETREIKWKLGSDVMKGFVGLLGLLWSVASTACLTALSCSLCGSPAKRSGLSATRLGHFISETTSKHGHSSHSSLGSCSAHWAARKSSVALLQDRHQYLCLDANTPTDWLSDMCSKLKAAASLYRQSITSQHLLL